MDDVERTRVFEASGPAELVRRELDRVLTLHRIQQVHQKALVVVAIAGQAIMMYGCVILMAMTPVYASIIAATVAISVVLSVFFWIRGHRRVLLSWRCEICRRLLAGLRLDHREPLCVTLDLGPADQQHKADGSCRFRDPWLRVEGTLQGGVNFRFQRTDVLRFRRPKFGGEWGNKGHLLFTRVPVELRFNDELQLRTVISTDRGPLDFIVGHLGHETAAHILEQDVTSSGVTLTVGHDRYPKDPLWVPLEMVTGLAGWAGLALPVVDHRGPYQPRPPASLGWRRWLACPGVLWLLMLWTVALLVMAGLFLFDVVPISR